MIVNRTLSCATATTVVYAIAIYSVRMYRILNLYKRGLVYLLFMTTRTRLLEMVPNAIVTVQLCKHSLRFSYSAVQLYRGFKGN